MRWCACCATQSLSVGILAVDPSSPFTGGAILGDRIRMQAHAYDRGVFIRSMSARGHLGGLAEATNRPPTCSTRPGKMWSIVETVGVGQSELEIAGTADTTVVVLTPAAGDMVQMLKAGIMEIADVFVVNKADMEGAGRLARDLRTMLNMGEHGAWIQPIVQTQATKGEGVEQVWAEVSATAPTCERPARWTSDAGSACAPRSSTLVMERVQRALLEDIRGRATFDALLDRAAAREIDPYQAANAILQSGVLTR